MTQSTQRALSKHSGNTHRAFREYSDSVIPSEPKILRLVVPGGCLAGPGAGASRSTAAGRPRPSETEAVADL